MIRWETIALGPLLGALIALSPMAASAQQAGPPRGAKYVAMGSSFAAGPRITTSADTPPNRCSRSQDNYAHQLARKRGLDLTDVSCGGATTAHLLGPWNELKPQLDAVDADTRLVTITIGGNDVQFNGRLAAQACVTAAAGACNAVPAAPTEQSFAELELRLRQIADEVRRRAPSALLVFVDYPTVVPPEGVCPALGLTAAQADLSRAVNQRVVAITSKVASDTKSGLLKSSAMSAQHHACSASPWTNGYLGPNPGPSDGTTFHPRLAAHTAIAEGLETSIWP